MVLARALGTEAALGATHPEASQRCIRWAPKHREREFWTCASTSGTNRCNFFEWILNDVERSGAAAPDRGLQGLLQELGLSQLALPLIKAMGPHNLEDQMQYTQLNTRVVDSLNVRGIP